MKYKILSIIGEIESLCIDTYDLSMDKIHGIDHLRQVAFLAGRFAISNRSSLEEVVIGGFLHDCARHDNRGGNQHAHESAKLAKEILIKHWPNIDIKKIYDAIYFHADGLVAEDPVAGCIWDADRISLTRLGTIPKLELLSTPVAKRLHKMFLRQVPLLDELKKISSLIINSITENGVAYLGVWCGEISKFFLTHIMILIEKILGEDLSKLKIISLYDYIGLPKTHDQSTCYQIYKECYHFGKFDRNQVLCPFHDNVTESLIDKILYCIIPFEFPLSPLLSTQDSQHKMIFKTSKINTITQDHLTRYFERNSKTPTHIYSVSSQKIKYMQNKIALIDNRIKRYFGHNYTGNKELAILTGLFKHSHIFNLSTFQLY